MVAVISLNLRRRHLDESLRAMVAARIATPPKGSNQHASIEAPTQEGAADLLNVSRSGVQRARTVLEYGQPEFSNSVMSQSRDSHTNKVGASEIQEKQMHLSFP
jgi:hypothetical protein